MNAGGKFRGGGGDDDDDFDRDRRDRNRGPRRGGRREFSGDMPPEYFNATCMAPAPGK